MNAIKTFLFSMAGILASASQAVQNLATAQEDSAPDNSQPCNPFEPMILPIVPILDFAPNEQPPAVTITGSAKLPGLPAYVLEGTFPIPNASGGGFTMVTKIVIRESECPLIVTQNV